MDKRKKTIILSALFATLLVVAVVLYNNLGKLQSGSNLGSGSQTKAPNFVVQDADGKEIQLSDFKGTPVVINFWKSDCPFCIMEMPDFERAHEKYPNVQFMMINAADGANDTVANAKNTINKNGYNMPFFFDTNRSALSAYTISSFPQTYFIDKNGNLITRASGKLNLSTIEKGISMITGG